MLALTLQHGVIMDLDGVKTGPSSGEMWGGFTRIKPMPAKIQLFA